MNAAAQICDCCEAPMEKAHRLHAGKRYCQRCYCREFKRLMCSGCGMFKRLLRSEARPLCQACVAAQPCVRCRRVGQPIGAMTEFGPACASCRVYFLEPRPCELCGMSSQRLSRVRTEEGEKQACTRCATQHHRSCVECRRRRLCEPGADGKWRCRPCIKSGVVPCATCSQPMPVGFGKRCEACYWRDRSQRNARQLVELISRAPVRDAFLAFAEWLTEENQGLQRRARRLREHANFFVALDQLEDEPWTGEFLLKHFGAAALRRYELPVRWLERRHGIQLSAEEKLRQADLRRVREAVSQLPPNTVARTAVEDFAGELIKRHSAGELSARSARLALRPAIALLNVEDPSGSRLPGQATLDRYLGQVPGQRAAVSTFLGFLKVSRGLHLRLPPIRSASSPAARKALERQIAEFVLESGQSGEVNKRWIPLALRYFHYLSGAESKAVMSAATPVHGAGGLELHFEGRVYWVPDPSLLQRKHPDEQ